MKLEENLDGLRVSKLSTFFVKMWFYTHANISNVFLPTRK